MKEKFLPWFLLFCALGLSGTAAYYSVIGLSVVFVGVALPVIVMGSFLEVSKIAIATYLHDKWKETYGILKIYMTIALVTLSLITSLGIYGLLSTGFQGNIAKLEIGEKQVKNVEVKKKRYEDIKSELSKEKTTIDGDITKLREGLSNNTTTQTVDKKTGQLITKANNANRKSFENQLKEAQTRRDTISKKIDSFNDSITKLDVQILDMQSKEISGSELGAIKYISELTGWSVKKTANIFILILIFVFDPLAITLVIATNQAFKSKRKEKVTIIKKDIDVPRKKKQIEEVMSLHEKIENGVWDINHRLKEDKNYSEQIKDEESKTYLKKEADRVWETVKKLKEKGIFTEPTEEELKDEPSALANSQYRNEYNMEEDTDQVPTNMRPSTDQVDLEDYFENKNYDEILSSKKVEEEEQQNLTTNINEPKRLTYDKRNGGSFRVNRI